MIGLAILFFLGTLVARHFDSGWTKHHFESIFRLATVPWNQNPPPPVDPNPMPIPMPMSPPAAPVETHPSQ